MWRKLWRSCGSAISAQTAPIRLNPVPFPPSQTLTETAFSPNPGNLRMFSFCSGNSRRGCRWWCCCMAAARRRRAMTPERVGRNWRRSAASRSWPPSKRLVNNPHTCFDWFNPEDITRGDGEVASIAAMIEQMLETHGLDRRRVFITGLSAGGAMTAAMLATYPELFAGGAIIAGLPFGAAANVRDALEAMRSAPLKTPQAWGDLVRAASSHTGPWPKISIWHGGLDLTVNISNAQASVAQWADLHGLALTGAKQEMVDGAIRLRWGDRLEVYTVPTPRSWNADRCPGNRRRCAPSSWMRVFPPPRASRNSGASWKNRRQSPARRVSIL